MTAAGHYAENPASDGEHQGAYEKICWKHENRAGIAHAAHVEDRNHDENSDANTDRVWLQRRHRRDERTDTGGNTHSGGEDIVGQQCGGGEQTWKRAEIKTRYSVGPAT